MLRICCMHCRHAFLVSGLYNIIWNSTRSYLRKHYRQLPITCIIMHNLYRKGKGWQSGQYTQAYICVVVEESQSCSQSRVYPKSEAARGILRREARESLQGEVQL